MQVVADHRQCGGDHEVVQLRHEQRDAGDDEGPYRSRLGGHALASLGR